MNDPKYQQKYFFSLLKKILYNLKIILSYENIVCRKIKE